jgi:TorA maturation chaperone TorD
MLLYPDEERLKTAAAVAGALKEEAGALAPFAFYLPWKAFLDALEAVDRREAARLQEEYVQLFVLSPEYVPCLPCESAYLPSPVAPGWTAISLEQEYAGDGLGLSPALQEAPDHVAVELEFMALLCGREAEAWEAERPVKGVEILRRQAAFLDEHLGRWLPRFAAAVAGKGESELYTSVTQAACAFIAHDRDLAKRLVRGLNGSDGTGSQEDA